MLYNPGFEVIFDDDNLIFIVERGISYSSTSTGFAISATTLTEARDTLHEMSETAKTNLKETTLAAVWGIIEPFDGPIISGLIPGSTMVVTKIAPSDYAQKKPDEDDELPSIQEYAERIITKANTDNVPKAVVNAAHRILDAPVPLSHTFDLNALVFCHFVYSTGELTHDRCYTYFDEISQFTQHLIDYCENELGEDYDYIMEAYHGVYAGDDADTAMESLKSFF